MTRNHFIYLAALLFPVTIYLVIRGWRRRRKAQRIARIVRDERE